MFEQIQEMVEKKIAADTKAIELQSAFFENVAKRQQAFVTECFEVVFGAAKDLGGVKTVGEALERQVAIGESLKSKIVALAETNTDEVKKLQSELTNAYAVVLPAAPKATKKAA
jgi:hypothetical protein